MRINLPLIDSTCLRIHRDNDALRTKLRRCSGYKFRVSYGRSIDRNLVRACIQELADVLNRAHTTTHCQRDIHFSRHALHGFPQLVSVAEHDRTAGFVVAGDSVIANFLGSV